MTGFFTGAGRFNSTGREYQLAFMVAELAEPLIAEARFCGDIPGGPWMFLARLGEGVPVASASFDHKLWTAIAEIGMDESCSPVRVRSGSVQLHATDAAALETIAGTSGLAGIAICVDRKRDRNDGLIFALTCLLEPRLPDNEGPVVWYGPPLTLELGGRS